MSISTDYQSLCASMRAVEEARGLPARFQALLHAQGQLWQFTHDHPQALRIGAEELARQEVTSAWLDAA